MARRVVIDGQSINYTERLDPFQLLIVAHAIYMLVYCANYNASRVTGTLISLEQKHRAREDRNVISRAISRGADALMRAVDVIGTRLNLKIGHDVIPYCDDPANLSLSEIRSRVQTWENHHQVTVDDLHCRVITLAEDSEFIQSIGEAPPHEDDTHPLDLLSPASIQRALFGDSIPMARNQPTAPVWEDDTQSPSDMLVVDTRPEDRGSECILSALARVTCTDIP
jgi:hypothetical protein